MTLADEFLLLSGMAVSLCKSLFIYHAIDVYQYLSYYCYHIYVYIYY